MKHIIARRHDKPVPHWGIDMENKLKELMFYCIAMIVVVAALSFAKGIMDGLDMEMDRNAERLRMTHYCASPIHNDTLCDLFQKGQYP